MLKVVAAQVSQLYIALPPSGGLSVQEVPGVAERPN